MDAAEKIDVNLTEELRDPAFRRRYFLAESSARIAQDLIDLRKRRGLDQKQVAELVGTQQPAISRIEQADYQNWSFNTLRKLAGALDARIRVEITPAEDVLKEYEAETAKSETQAPESKASATAHEANTDFDAFFPLKFRPATEFDVAPFYINSDFSQTTGSLFWESINNALPITQTSNELKQQIIDLQYSLDQKDRTIKALGDLIMFMFVISPVQLQTVLPRSFFRRPLPNGPIIAGQA